MKGRFTEAQPLRRLDALGHAGATELLPECNVILEAAAFCERNPTVTLADMLTLVNWSTVVAEEPPTAPETWYARCKEDFTQNRQKRTKLSWAEFSQLDAGRAVLNFAQSRGPLPK